MQLIERRHPVDTEPWGIKVTKVEVKQVDIPETMQQAIVFADPTPPRGRN